MYQRDKSIRKQSKLWEYILLQRKHLSFAGARSRMNTHLAKIDQETRKIE